MSLAGRAGPGSAQCPGQGKGRRLCLENRAPRSTDPLVTDPRVTLGRQDSQMMSPTLDFHKIRILSSSATLGNNLLVRNSGLQ